MHHPRLTLAHFHLSFSAVTFALRLLGTIVVLGGIVATSSASEASVHKARTSICHATVPDADDDTDVRALDEYRAFMQQLLLHERFDDLDCLADSARKNKAKFSGGMWKLHTLYTGIKEPRAQTSEEDWQAYVQRLNRWVATKPNSITARVALAYAYQSYAWKARGHGYAETVSGDAWKLFEERIDKSQDILNQAATLRAKCPEWYLAMQEVARSQGWNKARATALLERAVAFEPGYYYFYRAHANFLDPKWYGEPGESERFVEQVSNRLGGTAGDILYFQIASNMICHCNSETQLRLMSWPRMQRGFAALEKQSGASLINLNLMAYMATQELDSVFANRIFYRLGDRWYEDTWKQKSFFDANKKWATEAAAADLVFPH